ncbi:MAG TPA: DUF1097 domain-containing protein [Microscillaceae bacterium]|nr:DUF1097 domain-containing protein [Microscillaceae bacterium]
MKTFLTSLVMGFWGALAVFVSTALGWHTWVLFIAWVSYYLFGKNLKSSANSFLVILLGILMGVVIRLGAGWLVPIIGKVGFPLTVFVCIAVLNYIAQIKLLGNLPGWFLGLIIFFGAHPTMKPLPILELLIPVIAGFAFAILNDTGVKFIHHYNLTKEKN